MADDIFSVAPPAWLQDLTRPSEKGMAGKILGELVGGTAVAAQQAGSDVDKAQASGQDLSWGRAWLQDIPRGIAETRMNLLDPMWRVKMQEQALQVANLKSSILGREQQTDLAGKKAQHWDDDSKALWQFFDQNTTPEARLNATPPQFKTEDGYNVLSQRLLRDSQSLVEKQSLSDVTNFNKQLASIADPETVARIRAMPRGQNNMPTPDMWRELSAANKSAAETKASDIAARPTADLKNVQAVTKLRADAETLRLQGNVQGYQDKMKEAELMENRLSPKGVVSQLGYDDQGRPVMTTTIGGTPTVGTQTMTQQKQISFEIATEGINDIMQRLRPSDVGVAGVAGENIFDKWLAQLDPKLESGKRVGNRAALGTLREMLYQALSPERIGGSGFSNKDAERLKQTADTLEASHSYPEVIDRLNTIRDLIRDRSRVFAERTGQPVPDFAKTPEMLGQDYMNRLTALKKAVDTFTMTKEQADAEAKSLATKTADSLRRFHGIEATFK